ncbi:hypothetical protein C8F01DRAFT_230437 [Mycena amicta]|nr:hypothetical protein C8F01DRAFT_230437 [Mycena amicta]
MDAAHLATKHKYYVERAVQTDMPRSLSRADCKPVNPRVYDLSPTTPATMSNEDTISSNLSHGAYIYSPSSGGHPGPMRSPHLSRKHPQFPYRRPSQRVFSLPETSPPYATVTARETRGVSLTERARVSLTFSDNTPEISSSVETSFRSETRSGSSRARRSLPSSDIPHTPSPPSSPESVMIIGNNMQVPMAFLRQKAKPNHDEETGWISWASSPPKPIPALHGPLSLPYARCPSGAEGTIVEGEDLSRMIWGLGLQDDQPASTNSPNASHKPTSLPPRLQAQRHSQPSLPQQNVPLNRQSHELHRDETVPDARSRRTMQRHALESLGPRHSRVPSLAQQSDSWHDTFGAQSDLLESFEDQLHSYDGQRGLGLDWQETLRHHRTDPEKTKSSVSLKPSAPVFVPASQQTPSQFPRIFVEPRHTIAPSPRLSAFEIAQQYRDKRPQDLLPTPPSSSSPQWTPQQHYIDPFPPLDLHTLVPPPKSQPNFDLSQELRKFVFERMQNPDVIRSAEATYGQSITPRIPQSPRSSIRCLSFPPRTAPEQSSASFAHTCKSDSQPLWDGTTVADFS